MKKTSFKWHTEWNGIIIGDDNLLLPNTWTFVLEYDSLTDDILHKDIAMQRLEFMIGEKFETASWVNFANPLVKMFYGTVNNFMITLPTDPYDSLIAATAMLKAQNITKGVFEMHRCSIISRLGYSIENVIDFEEALEASIGLDDPQLKDIPWFAREDAGFTDILHTDDNNNTTLIKDSVDWSKYNLNWDFYYNQGINLDNNNKAHHTKKKERWTPTVIKGGVDTSNES